MDKGVDKGVDNLKVSTARNIIRYGQLKSVHSIVHSLSTVCPQVSTGYIYDYQYVKNQVWTNDPFLVWTTVIYYSIVHSL